MDADGAATEASVGVPHHSSAMDVCARGVSVSPELVLVPPLGTDDQSSDASCNAAHQHTTDVATGKDGGSPCDGGPEPAPAIEDGGVHGKCMSPSLNAPLALTYAQIRSPSTGCADC